MVTRHPNRREFVAGVAAAGVSILAGHRVKANIVKSPSQRKKALIGRPDQKTLESLKINGFDGIESRVWDISADEAGTYRQAADALEMRIHSVLRGWTNFNSPDADIVTADVASVEKALKTSQIYGADALLLVPCKRLAEASVPKPEEFDIEFDARTGHVTRVVAGDNGSFQDYMKIQNRATDMSRLAIEKLIPVAERCGVVIALENVWNDLWVKPKLFAQFVKSFDSPWVQTYFDIGNHVKYATPQEWIEALGKTIVKIHVKDFVVDRAANRGGKFVDIRDGDVDWPAVMKTLDNIGYQGWFTIEGSGGLTLPEQNRRLETILASK